jgi:serine/threonine protein phosphatase PrpC
MADTAQKTVWSLRGRSTRGSSHLRTGLPNQDALGLWSDESQSRAIVVVSDGHGSPRHFRSQTGAQFAVEAATRILRDADLPFAEETAPELCGRIVENWRASVAAHLGGQPFQASELEKIPTADLEQAQAALAENPTIAYGATLLAAVAVDSEILFLQLGDGDILCVGDDGETTRPVPADQRLIANQTTSLCQDGAAANFRVALWFANGNGLPALILLSSDGYSNSFHTDDDFLQVGKDYLSLIRRHGSEKVEAQLEHILSEASRKGSGDDITLGMLERVGAAPEHPQSEARAAPAGEPAPEAASSASKSAAQQARRADVLDWDSEPTPAAVAAAAAAPAPARARQEMPGRMPPAPMPAMRHTGETTAPVALRRKLMRYQIALAVVGVLAVIGIALAVLKPPIPWFHRHGSQALPASGVRLSDHHIVEFTPGAVLDAALLRLKPPFKGEILAVEMDHGKLMLHSRTSSEWSVSSPGDQHPRKVKSGDSVAVSKGDRLIFGKVTLDVV